MKNQIKEDLELTLKKNLTNLVPEIREICKILLSNRNKWSREYIDQIGNLRVKKLQKLAEEAQGIWDHNLDKLSDLALKNPGAIKTSDWGDAIPLNLEASRRNAQLCSFFHHILIAIIDEDFSEGESFLEYI